MKRSLVALTIVGGILACLACAERAEARGWHGRGWHGRGSFWGGFAAGAVTSALLGPAVVVAGPAPRVVLPPPVPRRVWVPGAYVVRYRRCGTPYRVWRRGYYAAY